MAAIRIPLISKDEYPLFTGIGVLSQFPPDYSAFLELFNQEKKNFTDKGIDTIDTHIDFAGFVKWFGTGRYATYSDLLQYAVVVAQSK